MIWKFKFIENFITDIVVTDAVFCSSNVGIEYQLTIHK